MDEIQPLNVVDQPTLEQLPDDLLRNIFHRLPSDPSGFAFVSVAYKAWRRVVHDEDNFLRHLRAAHANAPPLLGLFSDAVYGQALEFTPSTNSGAVNLPALPSPRFNAYGCTHGRLLLYSNNGEVLLVWDPLTGEEHLIPSPPPGFDFWQSCGAALVCDADHGNHGDCHSSPFRVVFAYSEDMPTIDWHAPTDLPPVHTFVCVYNSTTGNWGGGPVANFGMGINFAWKPSAVAGNGAAVFWMTRDEMGILEFDMETQKLRLILTPPAMDIRGNGFILAPTMDADVSLAGVMDGSVVLFAWGGGAWARRAVVRLDDILPFHAHDEEYQNRDDEDFWDDEDDWDEDEDEDGWYQRHNIPTGPRVLGFSAELYSVFLQAEPPGVFIINLESGNHQRVLETDQRLAFVYPYCSFYTAARKAILNDVQVDQENNNIQSGGEINTAEEKDSNATVDSSQ